VVAKLCVMILAIGTTAVTVLSLRQDRLRAVNALARTQQRMYDHDRTLFTLRVQIAERITPEHVEQMAAAIGATRPIVPDSPNPSGSPERAFAQAQTNTPEAARVKPVRHNSGPGTDPR